MTCTAVPKVELHCHIEGTLTPSLVRQFACQHGLQLPDGLFDGADGYVWSGFSEFLHAYDTASAFIRTAENYRDVIYDYLASAARQGAIYVEVFTSIDHASRVGIAYPELLDALARGIDAAEREFGIIGRMVVTCVRHLGPEQALVDAGTARANPHPYVVGFGMGGDEAKFTFADFAPAFHLMRDAGLPCTVHAGEVAGPESVVQALDHLPVSRIGHGVRAIEDWRVVERLVKDDIVLEICPGSNFALGIYDSVASHPFNRLRDAGVKVTLGSDDPPFFNTSIGAEYERASCDFGLNDDEIAGISAIALEAAFIDEGGKARLRERL